MFRSEQPGPGLRDSAKKGQGSGQEIIKVLVGPIALVRRVVKKE